MNLSFKGTALLVERREKCMKRIMGLQHASYFLFQPFNYELESIHALSENHQGT